MKLCVPELPPAAELVCVAGLVGRAECVAAAEGIVAAERLGVTEAAGVADGAGALGDPGVWDETGAADNVPDEPPEGGADAAAEFDPVPAHAVRPAPPTTTAMITAGTRHILMLLPPLSNQMLQTVTIMAQLSP